MFSLLDLKISRPGLWFPTIWIYLVPFANEVDFWLNVNFWLGLFFVTFPLNYLVYGLNDYNDIDADAVNARKGNFLFGAKASRSQLKGVLTKITILTSVFVVAFTFISGFKMFLLLLFMVVVNILYNFKPFRIKERPPFEILIQVGYVVTVFFSTELNNLETLPWQTLVYLSLFAFQAHIAGEIMDMYPDLASGKRTTATLIGRNNSKLLMLLILVCESVLVWYWFEDVVLASFLGLFSAFMILDILVVFKGRAYTLPEMKLFGYLINISALASMLWVLYSGKLLMV
ncbi:UbiA family prenyltransferase [Maribacter litoralis]|uniref:4-hydroxybenzoate polyprenyltransferase n=1 Tax=Maribacter litoralis TaxID=2059726 RepID=A0A653PTI4_9FLAO|nr:UbiA family prenyltransferase [Maribacter litoralis]VXB32955.1 4-hydroxybenzoate polyprenyltransferase [Maribacter litoralis]